MHISLTIALHPLQYKRRRLSWMKRLNSLCLLFAATLSIAAAAQVKSPTDPPPGQRVILTVTGKGVQIYECRLVVNVPHWAFQAPDASLYDESGAKVGVHGEGPSWRYFDGSSVKGEVVAQSAAPDPAAAIPWLLLKAANNDDSSGIMAKAEFIRRSDTHGGVTPTVGCDAQHLSVVSRVPYTATYTFYSAKP
jgi:Protein of unknown function (DUF3455)